MQSRTGNDLLSRPRIMTIPLSLVRDSDERLEAWHPRFGPLLIVEQGAVDGLKERAWEHVVRSSSADTDETTETYMDAVRKVEGEAVEMYALAPQNGSQFRQMMIKDGCLFLQLVLLLVGCRELLGYPENDPIFGREQRREDIQSWMKSMFHVGNQIPLLVLRVLMEQTFFKEVMAKANWGAPPSGLCEKLLYQVLVLPSLAGENQGRSLIRRVMGGGPRGDDIEQQQQQQQLPLCDLLHASRHLLMGPPTQDHHHQSEGSLLPPGDRAAHRQTTFPSATNLRQRVIYIKRLKRGGGARGIRFRSRYFWAILYVPALLVDENAELLLTNLYNYDRIHRPGQNGREFCSYLRLLSALIQTKGDARLLHNKGILQGEWANVKKLPAMLRSLHIPGDNRLTPEHGRLRNQIRNYTSPRWVQNVKGLLSFVAICSFIQTFFVVLTYFKPPKAN